jgi:ADP-ribosylglycohydrolase
MTFPTKDRYAGCLVGQAIGDALGFPVEGHGPEVCARYVDSDAFGAAGRAGFPFGQYTDDTQLARELLESWVVHRRWHPEDFAVRVAALFTEGRIVGRGRATEEAAMRLARGIPWTEAGTPAPSAGNGSAMRAAPVGLMCVGDPWRLGVVGRDQSRVTHADVRCQAGSVAIAAAVAAAVLEDDRDPDAFLVRVAEQVREVDEDFAGHLEWLVGQVAGPPEEVAPLVRCRGVEAGFEDGWRGISPFVVGSVLWALYAYLKADEADLYLDTVRIAIRVGGDVDTTAAMAGAIAGARAGLAGLPPLARAVNDRGTWGYEALVALAERGWRLAVKAC